MAGRNAASKRNAARNPGIRKPGQQQQRAAMRGATEGGSYCVWGSASQQRIAAKAQQPTRQAICTPPNLALIDVL